MSNEEALIVLNKAIDAADATHSQAIDVSDGRMHLEPYTKETYGREISNAFNVHYKAVEKARKGYEKTIAENHARAIDAAGRSLARALRDADATGHAKAMEEHTKAFDQAMEEHCKACAVFIDEV